jgi:hypothetical protein
LIEIWPERVTLAVMYNCAFSATLPDKTLIVPRANRGQPGVFAQAQ